MHIFLSNLVRGLRRVGSTVMNVVTSRVFLLIVALIVLVQLVYPHDRALPLAKLDSMSVGTMKRSEISTKLTERYRNATVSTATPATKMSFKDAGIKLAPDASASPVVTYPLWQRLIPLSSVVRMLQPERHAVLEFSALPVSQWGKQVVEQCAKKPMDAGITVTESGELKLVPGKTGLICNEQQLITSLKSTSVSPQLKVDSKYVTVQPKRSDKQVSQQLTKLRGVLTRGITFDVAGTLTTADAKTIAGWLVFSDGPNNTLLADVDPAKVQPFIDQLQKPVYIAPGTTIVTFRDGVEIGRAVGAAGRGIDVAKLLESTRQQLRSTEAKPVTVALAPIAPREEIRRTYTATAQGLQALLNDLVSGRDMAISIRELTGQGLVANANGDKTYHPASTYKLFIAYSLMRRIEAHQINWTDQIEGKSVDECLTRMIVNSDNACAEAFADKFSWGAVQSELKGLGLTKTNVNNPSPVSTVNDQVLFLQKLEAGQLMNAENKNKLIELMKRQVYRSGIPAGVNGAVADKVGFLSGLLHDSAIIYGPKGTYVLSIYSNGGSWANIADAARKISQLLGN